MLQFIYAPHFVRQFKRLPPELQEETIEKITLFKQNKNHDRLKVHKLHGRFSDCYGFSINFKTRIIFEHISKNKIAFLAVGDHEIYQ